MLRAAILGATGMVGQRFIESLQDHPDFSIEVLTASERSAGRRFGECVEWILEREVKKEIKEIEVASTSVEGVDVSGKVDVVFSALPASVALEAEPEFAESFPVFSNAGAFRREPDVPILIPEVNPEHIGVLTEQRRRRGWKGFIVTNSNCTTAGLAISLKPILDRFGVRSVRMASMQAVSGAGYRGSGAISAMQITDNILPFIKGEEEKVEFETKKILGTFASKSINLAGFEVETACNRVPVLDGHTESVFVTTDKECDPEVARESMARFDGEPQKLGLYTAPRHPIWVMEEENRPQPRFDRMLEGGMAMAVGRIRQGASKHSLRYTLVVHNTIRGSAGGSVLNAELLKATGYL